MDRPLEDQLRELARRNNAPDEGTVLVLGGLSQYTAPAPGGHRATRWVLAAVAAAVLIGAVGLALWPRSSDSSPVGPSPDIETPTTTSTFPWPTVVPAPPATVLPAAGARWRQTSESPLTTRSWSSQVWTGDRLLVWGGQRWDDGSTLADGAAYDPATDTWVALPAAPITSRAFQVAVWTGSEMVIWGGGGGNTDVEVRTDGAAYDPTTGRWRTIAASPLPEGPLYAGAWTGDELVIVAKNPDGTLVAGGYDPDQDSWRSIDTDGAALPSDSFGWAVDWTGDRLVANASHPYGGPVALAVYDPSSGSWATTAAPDYASRSFATTTLDGEVYLASYMQSDGTTSFDPVTSTWGTPIDVGGLDCEGGPVIAAVSDRIFLSNCGESGLYDPESATWQLIPGPEPELFAPYQPVALGDQLLVWSGRSAGSDARMTSWILSP